MNSSVDDHSESPGRILLSERNNWKSSSILGVTSNSSDTLRFLSLACLANSKKEFVASMTLSNSLNCRG